MQAEPNKLATSQPDVSNGSHDAAERINEAYFDSYGFFGIHREMISDKVKSRLPKVDYACLYAYLSVIPHSTA